MSLRTSHRITRAALGLAVGPLLAFSTFPTQAATYNWDTDVFANGFQDGAGFWSTQHSYWANEASILAWSYDNPPHSAVIGSGSGEAGTITVTEDIYLKDLIFNAPGSGIYTIASLSTGSLQFSTPSVIAANHAVNISAKMVSSEGIRKEGLATLTLNGALSNEISGLTLLAEGNLQLNKSGGAVALGGTIRIETGTNLQWGSYNDQLAAGTHLEVNGGNYQLNGRNESFASYTQTAGGLTLSNTGIVTVSGAFKMSGGVVYTINSGGSLSAQTIDLRGYRTSGAALNVGGASALRLSTVHVGSGGLWLDGQTINLNYGTANGHHGSQLNLQGNVTASGVNNINSPGLMHNYPGTVSQVQLGSSERIFDIATNGSLNFQNLLTMEGTGGFIKRGEGSMTFALEGNPNGVNVGTIKIEAGKIAVSRNNILADNTHLRISGGKYELGGKIDTIANLTLTGGQFESGNSAHFTLTEALTLQGGGTLTVNSGAAIHTHSLSLSGAGVVTLGGANTTTVTQLNIGEGGLHLSSNINVLSVSTTAGQKGLEWFLQGDLTSVGTSAININTSAALLSGSVTQFRVSSGDHTFHVTDTFTLQAPLAGNGTIYKEGLGILKLTGNHSNSFNGTFVVAEGQVDLQKNTGKDSFAGDLQIEGGTVFISTSHQLAATSSILQNGGTLNLNNRDESFLDYIKKEGTVVNNAGFIEITGTLKGIGGTSMTDSPSNPIYTINSGGHTSAHTLDFSESTKSYALLLGGSSATILTKFTVGAGGLKLNGNRLTFNRENTGSELVLNGDVTATGSNQFTRGTAGTSGENIAQIQQGNSTRIWNIISGTTQSDLPIVGIGAGVTKTGNGTLELREVSTYTGKTSVNAGTLRLTSTGGLSQTSWLELRSGATFDASQLANGFVSTSNSAPVISGSGNIVGHVTLGQGSRLLPGLSLSETQRNTAGALAGTLTITGNLDAQQSASHEVISLNLGPNGSDKILITGNLYLNQHSQVKVSFDEDQPSYGYGDSWTLMEWQGSLYSTGFSTGTNGRTGLDSLLNEGNLDLPTLAGPFYWEINSMDLTKSLLISIAPEPSKSLLILLSFITLMMNRRR